MNTGVIFYNGFNLMIDILIFILAGAWYYSRGHRDGYSEGAEDKRAYDERLIDYYLEHEREARS